MGTGDPVLPSGLIQMISDQYVPQDCGIGKEVRTKIHPNNLTLY